MFFFCFWGIGGGGAGKKIGEYLGGLSPNSWNMPHELRIFWMFGIMEGFGKFTWINPALNHYEREVPTPYKWWTHAYNFFLNTFDMFNFSMKPIFNLSQNLEVEAIFFPFFYLALKLGPLNILVASQGQSGIDRRCQILFSTSHGLHVTGFLKDSFLGCLHPQKLTAGTWKWWFPIGISFSKGPPIFRFPVCFGAFYLFVGIWWNIYPLHMWQFGCDNCTTVTYQVFVGAMNVINKDYL